MHFFSTLSSAHDDGDGVNEATLSEMAKLFFDSNRCFAALELVYQKQQ